LHYEFNDWNNRISIEAMADLRILPELKETINSLATRHYEKLPEHTISYLENHGWSRFQVLFEECVEPRQIATAMNIFIKDTLGILKDSYLSRA
jgi:hypothetical protein